MEAAAQAAAIPIEDAARIFADAMRYVEDYVISSDLGFVACRNVGDAQKNRLAILDYIRRMQLWDEWERPIVQIAISKNKVAYQALISDGFATREEINDMVRRFISRIGHYVDKTEHRAYWSNPAQYVATNTAKVMRLIERHPSWTEPHVYKPISIEHNSAEILRPH